MKMSKKDEIRAKKHAGMIEIAPFFEFFPEPPLQRNLAPSKLNFAAPIEIRWLGLCSYGDEKKQYIT